LERCGDIVSGLLSFSRETPEDYTIISLNETLESVIALTKHRMELQSIQLISRLFPGLLMVHGNSNQLQQCLLNLIFNAMEAMPEGGKLKVMSKLDSDKEKVRIEIHDTGFGIDRKDLNHIFDPFFTTKKEGRGTGLGLSIAYGVVKKHSGDIWVKSKPGKGSSFFISLPCKAPASDHMEESHGR
jgi:signal transduction histidine kinase